MITLSQCICKLGKQVAFLPLEIWGGSPPGPRGIPIIGPRKIMQCSAVLFTIPNPKVQEGALASQQRAGQVILPWPIDQSTKHKQFEILFS